MKKFTAMLTTIFMVLTVMLVPIQVFATDNEYVLSTDDVEYFIVEVLGEDEKVLATSYYNTNPKEDSLVHNSQDLYGELKVKLRFSIREDVTIKVLWDAIVPPEERAEEFVDVDTIIPGVVTDVYELEDNPNGSSHNTLVIQYMVADKVYYAELALRCLPKDYFLLYLLDSSASVPMTSVLNSTSDEANTVKIEYSSEGVFDFRSYPANTYADKYDIKINGYMNTSHHFLASGENYFTIEYKGKTYNLVINNKETTAWTNPFSDVNTSDAAFNSIKYCNMNGLMLGTSDSTFTPDAVTTRAMVVTTLYRIAGSPEVKGTNKFADVEAGSWYYDAVTWANENGIVLGYENGNFGTNDNITREQFATIMYRYAKKIKPEMNVVFDPYPYSDDDVADYAKEPMKLAILSGMLKTADTINTNPKQTVSRSDLAMGIAALDKIVLSTLKSSDVVYN